MNELELFAAAIAVADPTQRAALLDRTCADDPALRDRLEALLGAHDRPNSMIDNPVVAAPAPEYGPMRDCPPGSDPGGTRTFCHDGAAPVDDKVLLGFLAAATRPDSLGRLGHYEVLQVLGHGGFGIVLRAFDDVLQRVVAVKVLSPQLAATSPARKRFIREARSSAQVRHENVVQVYEIGEQPLPYIAMEFIPGETLQQRLDRTGPLDVAEVLRIGGQIAAGLAAAHATELIHRDIKPANILLEGGPQRVKITDFGLARTADDASISQSGLIAGTPLFMAPEQIKGELVDQRADLFSLGSVLYQMVAGRPPFRANGTLAVLQRVAEDTPRPIRDVIPEAPQWLCDIIAKLHAKNPDDRFQSAREVADILAECEAQLKTNTKLQDFFPIPVSTTAKSPSQTERRKTWKASLVPVAFVALAIVATAFGTNSHVARAVDNEAAIEIEPEPGWVSVIVHRDGQAVTDWYDLKQNTTITLPPGKYQIEPGFAPGRTLSQWSITTHGWLTSNNSVQFQRACEIEIARGDRITLRAVMRDDPPTRVGDPTPNPLKSGAPEYTNTLGMTLKFIPLGTFTMGSSQQEIDRCIRLEKPWTELLTSEGPEHEVEITQAFYMGATEVTVGQFRQFVEANPDYNVGDDRWRTSEFTPTDRHPVGWMSWEDALTFCKWLSAKEGKTYRLPTEAEWEYCCRAGKSGTRYCFGDEDTLLKSYGGYGRGTSPVGKTKPNDWGLYDMHGNVWQWCQDNYDPNYYRNSPVKDPMGPSTNGDRVIRGGSWWSGPVDSRSAMRSNRPPDTRFPDFGFRVLLVAPPGGVWTEDNPMSTAANPDRKAAEYVLALGGSVRINEHEKEIMGVADLPRGSFRLTYASLRQNGQVSDAGLVVFKECSHLKGLELDGTPVGDEGLAHFKGCKNLTALHLDGTQVGKPSVAQLKSYPILTTLTARNTKLSLGDITELAKALPQCKIEFDGGVIEPTSK